MAKDYGVKISKERIDVKTASLADLQLTSKYPVLKAIKYGQVSTTAYTWKQIGHGLSYAPQYLVWGKGSGNTYRFIAPRRVIGSDPIGGIILIRAYTDTTNLNIVTSVDSDVYYYIFVDPL